MNRGIRVMASPDPHPRSQCVGAKEDSKRTCQMLNWSFIALLHNLSIQRPVENDCVAIVPDTDGRALKLLEASPALRRLVTGFTDQFGRQISPSLLVVHQAAPQNILDQDALIGFRNALAICTIVYAWQEYLVSQLSLNVLKYSNYFDLYPITVGRDDVLVIRSPSTLGVDEPDEFTGQISPELASTYRVSDFYDSELLSAILGLWHKRFVQKKISEWSSRVLFRSLEMAYHASAIPFENSSTIYDYGAKIALWVSAFEVLVRSETEHASLSRVLGLLKQAQLSSPRLRHKRHTVSFSTKKRERGTLSQKIYSSMYAARNSFLHGNPVGIRDLFINRHLRYYPLTTAAPILYKQALQSFLQIPRLNNISDYAMKQYADIRNFEEAICALSDRCPQRSWQRPTQRSTARD